MTGTLITKQNSSGQSYYYVKLSYKDPLTHKWKQKMVSTHMTAKGNKRKAESLKNEVLAIGSQVLEGEKGIEQGAEEIAQKFSLYLKE